MMKSLFSIILIVVVLVLSACSGTRLQKQGPGSIKVLSYNIHHANPPSKPGLIDLEAIAKVIKESEADIVGLQEVDVHTERSGKDLDEAAELGRLTGMHHYFVKGIDYQGGEYGIAILSRFPFLKTDSLRLPMAPGAGGEPRVLAIVDVEPVKGKVITFANTHMELKPENRNLQAREIISHLNSKNNPVIFCGDLNAKPGSDVISLFENAFFRSSIPNGNTFPEKNPRTEIDHILFKPKDRFKVLQHSVIKEEYASDHRPLLVELQLK